MNLNRCARITTWILLHQSYFTRAKFRARGCNGTIRHVHIAAGTDPSTEITISFSSRKSKQSYTTSYTSPFVAGGVSVGTAPDNLKYFFREEEPARSYSTPLLGHGGTYYSPYQHHIKIQGLQPSTTYYYQCKVWRIQNTTELTSSSIRKSPVVKDEINFFETSKVTVSEEQDEHRRLKLIPYDSSLGGCPPPNKIRSFRTAPPPGQGSVKFAVLGDLGQFLGSILTMRRLSHHRHEIDAVLLTGDIAYIGYDHRKWDNFFDFMDDFSVIDETPLHVCAGNHDIEKPENSSEIFVAYENRFKMPQLHPAQLGLYDGPPGYMNMEKTPYPLPYEYGNSYYAYTYGPSRHIFMNSYSSMEPNSTQYQWLLEELSMLNRTQTPWVFVILHTPMYNTFSLHRNDVQMMSARKHIEPLLIRYRVNLAFSGHIHAYLRTKCVVQEEVHPVGPMHITVGASGRQAMGPFQSEEPEEWVAARDSTRYGFGTIEILNVTHALWQWIPTSESDYQSTNVAQHSNATIPSVESDIVIIHNQIFQKSSTE